MYIIETVQLARHIERILVIRKLAGYDDARVRQVEFRRRLKSNPFGGYRKPGLQMLSHEYFASGDFVQVKESCCSDRRQRD